MTLTFDPLFMINLPYLDEYLRSAELREFSSDLFLNTSIHAVLPPLAVDSAEYSLNLAHEKTYSFDMQDIINNTKNDVMTYQSLSHYLYNVLLNAHNRNRDFDFFMSWTGF